MTPIEGLDVGCGDVSGCPVVSTLPSNAEVTGSIPGCGAKISHASWLKIYIYIKEKQYCNKFNETFENGPHQKNLKKKKKTGMWQNRQ